MNFKVQTFPAGHPLYTDNWIENNDKEKGVVGKFQTNFGQITDENGEHICYCFQRRDTAIPDGTYKFIFYDSPANKMVVPLLVDVPGFSNIELHPANWSFQLKGCTAPCLSINVSVPQASQSRNAFNVLMGLMDGKEGEITYETLK